MKKILGFMDSMARVAGAMLAIAVVCFSLDIAFQGPARAIQNIDQIITGGTFQLTNNGSVVWSAQSNGTNNATIQNNVLTAGTFTNQLTLDGAGGGVLIPAFAKAQIDKLTPGFTGELITDIGGTISPQLCISTGTAIDQWSVYGAGGNGGAKGCGNNN